MRDERQRIDRWLWHARLVRTRPSAAALAESGHVRLNGQRVTTSSRAVKIDDVLTIVLPGHVKVFRVAALAERRGGAAEARQLYDDLIPREIREPNAPPPVQRESGSGRPTKRERRALERMRQRGPGRG